MNRMGKVVLVVVLALLMVVPLAGAQEQNIVEVAVNDGRFDTLVAAVVAADLADTLAGGEWTVFAPTDDAFAKLGLDASNVASALSSEDLTDILLYHVLPGNVSSGEAKANQGDIVMANGAIAGLKFFDGSLWVNDDSRVIIQDIVTENGVIHVVDTVILPPWPRVDGEEPSLPGGDMGEMAPAGNSIVDIAVNDGRFDTLVAAVTATGLADTLAGGEWTVFAPTDDAFAKLGLDASTVASAFSEDELANILLYHVLPGNVSSAEAKANQGNVVMANGELAGIKYFDGSLYVNDDSKVIIENILADNGTIHVVDTVILGPWPRE
jgi:uncharacterized surface protein with fasciclin (FAS1) repeats